MFPAPLFRLSQSMVNRLDHSWKPYMIYAVIFMIWYINLCRALCFRFMMRQWDRESFSEKTKKSAFFNHQENYGKKSVQSSQKRLSTHWYGKRGHTIILLKQLPRLWQKTKMLYWSFLLEQNFASSTKQKIKFWNSPSQFVSATKYTCSRMSQHSLLRCL